MSPMLKTLLLALKVLRRPPGETPRFLVAGHAFEEASRCNLSSSETNGMHGVSEHDHTECGGDHNANVGM